MTPDLPALLARVESATGPDRELDGAIYWHLLEENRAERALWWVEVQFSMSPWGGPSDWRLPYTSSIDASLSLVERVMPGWAPSVGKNVHHGYWHAALRRVDEANGDILEFAHSAPTPSLALLAALLRARIAETTHE